MDQKSIKNLPKSRSGGILEASWERLGGILGRLGGVLWGSLGRPGVSWERPGIVAGRPGWAWKPLVGVLWASWNVLEVSSNRFSCENVAH